MNIGDKVEWKSDSMSAIFARTIVPELILAGTFIGYGKGKYGRMCIVKLDGWNGKANGTTWIPENDISEIIIH